MNTPSISLRVWPTGSSVGAAGPAGAWRHAEAPARRRRRTQLRHHGAALSYSSSRTVSDWIGTATTSVLRGGGDVGGAGEAGADLGRAGVEGDDDLEIGGGARGGRRRLAGRRLNRAVADLGDPAGEGLAADGVDGHDRLLADLHQGNVGLVDFDLGLDHRHVGHGEQHRAGVVHGADDDVLTLLDVAAGDDAVEGRLEARLRQVVAAADQPGLLLAHLLLAGADLLRAGVQVALAHLDLGFGLLERLARRQARLPQFLLPLERLAGDVEAGLGALHLHARLLEAGAGAGDAPLRRGGPRSRLRPGRSAAGTGRP